MLIKRFCYCFSSVLILTLNMTWVGVPATMAQGQDSATQELKTLSESFKTADLTRLQEVIDSGADVNVKNKHLETPLHLAAESGQEHIVKLLLGRHADVNPVRNDGATPLILAAWYGHKAVVKLLLGSKADVDLVTKEGVSPLYISARYGHETVVKLLLGAKADVDLVTKKGVSPLYISARYGHKGVVKDLINANADVNFKRNTDQSTALIISSLMGHGATVRLLLEAGADVNAVGGKERITPLTAAAFRGHVGVVLILLEAKADKNATSLIGGKDSTALDLARDKGYSEIARLLGAKDRSSKPGDGGQREGFKQSKLNSLLSSLNDRIIVRHSGAVAMLTDKAIVMVSRKGRETFTITGDTLFCIGSQQKVSLAGMQVGSSATVTTLSDERTSLSVREGGLVFTISQFGASPANAEACDKYIVASWIKKDMMAIRQVCEVQELLTGLGFSSGKVDGVSGRNTVAAIERYLNDNGLKANAEVNDKVVQALRASYDKKERSLNTEQREPIANRPENGQVLQQSKTNKIAPLKIVTPDQQYDFVVKMVRKKNGEHLKTFFVRGGSVHETQVPLGQLELKYAAGEHWYSKNCLFGRNTLYSKADKIFDFSQKGDNVVGYTVELILQAGGNLPTSEISQSDW